MPTEANVTAVESANGPSVKQAQNTPPKTSPEANRKNSQTGRPQRWISQALVPIKAQLASRQAQKLYRYNFQTAAHALYTMSVILPTMIDAKSVASLGEVMDNAIAEIKIELQSETERCTKLAEENGIDLTAVKHSQPKDITVEINSPRGGQYFALIRGVDRLISMFDMLWLSGLYSDSQYNTACYQWQKKIARLANRFRSMSQRAMALAHRRMDDNRNASLSGLINPDGDFVFEASVNAIAAPEDQDEGAIKAEKAEDKK